MESNIEDNERDLVIVQADGKTLVMHKTGPRISRNSFKKTICKPMLKEKEREI